MSDAHVNGIDIHYETYGEPGATPVLFIHGGFGGPNSTLTPAPNAITQDFPDGFHLVTFDRRCAGLSSYPQQWFDLSDIAADARALLEHLGIDESIVVGSSMGGMVALQYVSSFAANVSALGLMNTGADLMTHTTWGQRLVHQAERLEQDGEASVYSRYRERLRQPPAPDLPDSATAQDITRARDAHRSYIDALNATDDEKLSQLHCGMVRNARAFAGHDFTSMLGDIEVPTLIVHGNADDVVPYDYSLTLASRIPGAEFHTIDGAGHGILQNRQARSILHGWLQNLD